MIEKLNELEKRVEAIVERCRANAQTVRDLRTANEDLTERLSKGEGQADENRTMREKLKGLEEELAAFNEKEGEVRGRLQTILERLSTLEEDLQEETSESDSDEQ